jgi:hypothetical protein
MATITLESDSSHSPLGLHQSNERSSQKTPKIQQIWRESGSRLREFPHGRVNNFPALVGDFISSEELKDRRETGRSRTRIWILSTTSLSRQSGFSWV